MLEKKYAILNPEVDLPPKWKGTELSRCLIDLHYVNNLQISGRQPGFPARFVVNLRDVELFNDPLLEIEENNE